MKKIIMSFSIILAIGFGSSVFAYQYSEAEKNAMYDLFIASYLSSATQEIQKYPIANDKKQQMINFVKNNVNKQQLINQTWGCVQSKHPTDQQGVQSCFIPFAKQQSADFTEYVMKMNY